MNISNAVTKITASIVGALLILAVSFSPASADSTGYPSPSKPCLINSSSITICNVNTPGIPSAWYGAYNNNLVAQTVTVTCYDTPTPGTLTGTATVIGALGVTQTFPAPAGGKIISYGWTCQASGAPNTGAAGTGIELYINSF